MFRAWKKAYVNGFWGVTVSREERFPRNDDEKKMLTNALGIDKFTMRLDWKTFISPECAVNINKRFKHLDIEPGLWIHDYKTAGKRENNPVELYNNSSQGFVYPTVYNILHPEEPCKGAIYHRVVNNKETAFQHVAVKATQRNKERSGSFLRNGELLLATDMTLGVAKGCRFFYRPCEYLGECDQIGGA